MVAPTGFMAVKRGVIEALATGRYQFEARREISVKNLLATGEVSAAALVAALRRCTGSDHASSSHHRVPGIVVHVIKAGGWYLKFYFLEPETWFISVHK